MPTKQFAKVLKGLGLSQDARKVTDLTNTRGSLESAIEQLIDEGNVALIWSGGIKLYRGKYETCYHSTKGRLALLPRGYHLFLSDGAKWNLIPALSTAEVYQVYIGTNRLMRGNSGKLPSCPCVVLFVFSENLGISTIGLSVIPDNTRILAAEYDYSLH